MPKGDIITIVQKGKIVSIQPEGHLDIKLTFGLTAGRKVLKISQVKFGANVYDPKECWLPRRTYSRIFHRAAAILLNGSREKKDTTLDLPFSQSSRMVPY